MAFGLSWDMRKKFLCTNYHTFLPALQFYIQDFYSKNSLHIWYHLIASKVWYWNGSNVLFYYTLNCLVFLQCVFYIFFKAGSMNKFTGRYNDINYKSLKHLTTSIRFIFVSLCPNFHFIGNFTAIILCCLTIYISLLLC